MQRPTYDFRLQPPPERKPVGIAYSPPFGPGGEGMFLVVCEDGSVWRRYDLQDEWERQKAIPGSWSHTTNG